LSLRSALEYGEQLLRAVSFAHEQHVIHCDVKPDNLLLFPDGRLRLTDFGISKVAHRTISASGAGTVGYMAPEQAMVGPREDPTCSRRASYCGKCSRDGYPMALRVALEVISRLRLILHPDMITLLKRSVDMKPGRRFEDGGQMLAAYLRAKQKCFGITCARANRKSSSGLPSAIGRRFGFRIRNVSLVGSWILIWKCHKCDGPVSEYMLACPWCGESRQASAR